MGAKEVAAGASWLDSNFPGWEREIDLGTLNLKKCDQCICGQSLRKFVDARYSTGYKFAQAWAYETSGVFPIEWATSHGFYSINGEWDEDEAFWVELIKERFSTGNLSG